MNLGLQHYFSSTRKGGLRFCLILEQSQWQTSEAGSRWFGRVAELMTRAEYQTVAGGRPLLYLGAAGAR